MASWSLLKKRMLPLLERYGIVLAGAVIFFYYLWSALDLFANAAVKRGVVDYIFQFDTVIVLWLLLVVGAKLQEHKRRQKEEAERNRQALLEHERQRIRLELLDEVTAMLTDAVHNPLSVISVSTGSLRERFSTDHEVTCFIERIEGALNRLREVLLEFQQSQTRKILKATESSPPPAEKAYSPVRVSALGLSRSLSSP